MKPTNRWYGYSPTGDEPEEDLETETDFDDEPNPYPED